MQKKNKIFLLAALIIIFFLQSAFAKEEKTKNVAILYLNNMNKNPNYDYLRESVPTSLATSLKQSGKFNIIDMNLIESSIKKLNIGDKYSVDFDKAVEIGKSTGTDIVIKGNIIVLGSRIEISLEAIDTVLGKIKIAETESGDAGLELFDVIDNISYKMTDKMLKELPEDEVDYKTKRETSIENQYMGSSRKGWWFMTSAGMLIVNNLWKNRWPVSDEKNNYICTTFGLGFGYKIFRLYVIWNLPVISFKKRYEGESDEDIRLTLVNLGLSFEVLKNRLIVNTGLLSFNYNPMIYMTNEWSNFSVDNRFLPLGVRVRIVKELFFEFNYNIPLYNRFRSWVHDDDIKTKMKRNISFSSTIEWIIYQGFGFRFNMNYFQGQTEEVDGGIRSSDGQIYDFQARSFAYIITLVYNKKF